MKIRLSLLVCVALALPACQAPEDPQAAVDEQAAADEREAAAMAEKFEEQFAQQNWELAAAHGDILLAMYPESAAAAGIKARHAEARAKADAASEQRRTAALWSYQSKPVDDGQQVTAAIYARDNVDTDGSGARPVRLIFRDHPDWGASAYLTLEAGDFDCYGGCQVQLTVDDQEPRSVAASRPATDEAIAMFIEDQAALWQTVQDAEVIAIEFPVKAGGMRTAVFEVGGLTPAKMPW